MYSFRYALGRMTYCVSDVADALVANRDRLTEDWRQQIVQDIREAMKEGRAGHQCDIDKWESVIKSMTGGRL
jgi:hypothetical protein